MYSPALMAASRPVSASRVEMTELVLPQHTNAHGHLFGGQLVCWLDICASVAAQRHASSVVVTASIDAVHFLAPIRQGFAVILRSQVNAVFTTSLECGVSVWAEDPMTGERRKAAKAYATMVALDQDGRPKAVFPLALETEEDRRRAAAAAERRLQRLAARSSIVA